MIWKPAWVDNLEARSFCSRFGVDPDEPTLSALSIAASTDPDRFVAAFVELTDLPPGLAEVVAALGTTKAFEALEDMLRSPDPRHRMDAAWALGGVGRYVEPDVVVALMDDGDGDVRDAAIRLAGGVRSTRIAEKLVALAADEDDEVREAALGDLARRDVGEGGEIDLDPVLNVLRAGITDEWLPCRLAAAWGLVHLGDRASSRLIASRFWEASDWYEREVLLEVLGRLGGAGAVAVLRWQITDETAQYRTNPKARPLGEVARRALDELEHAIREGDEPD